MERMAVAGKMEPRRLLTYTEITVNPLTSALIIE
jgi:hypothetical protein